MLIEFRIGFSRVTRGFLTRILSVFPFSSITVTRYPMADSLKVDELNKLHGLQWAYVTSYNRKSWPSG
jgi:hypothetical protein